jgi:CHAT domain-containing protein
MRWLIANIQTDCNTFDRVKNQEDMSTAELKIKLIHQITNLTDARVIEQIQQLLDFELNNIPYALSSEQSNRVAEAKSEYASGNTLSEKKANDEMDQWLNEK